MKKLLAYCLLLVLVVHTTWKGTFLLQFFWNQSEIVRELCVKRFSAVNTCQGACFLKHVLAISKNDSHEAAELVSVTFQELLLFLPGNEIVLPDTIHEEKASKYFPPYWFFFSDFLHTIFHPPD